MFKNLTLVAVSLLLLPVFSNAQKRASFNNYQSLSCSKAYLGINMGINNPNGFFGLSMDIPVIEHLTISAGAGLSTWGWKYYGEARGYLGKCHSKWALGLGASRNTGIADFTMRFENTYGSDEVKMELLPQTNMFINFYHFWQIGKNKLNRFYLMAGYSIPLENDNYYTIKPESTTTTLTTQNKNIMKTLQPGGISVGWGWYFNVSSSNN